MSNSNGIRPVLNQAEIESLIMDTSDSLELLVEEYSEIAEAAGTTEVEFKRRQAMTYLSLIEHPPKDADGNVRKMIAAERDARVELLVTDARRDHAIAAARREVSRESMNVHRTRIDALRTLAANVRYLTTDRGN
jgi:hypothetical protein